MIACQGVTKRFGSFTALDNISLEIPKGVSVLLGPNGAGKSTLLKILTGLLKADSGSISIDGKPPNKNNIGVLPEDLGLFDSLTIQEHLELSGPIYGLSLAETRSRAEELLRLLSLTAGRHTFLDRCSHGMRKKTALALALLHNPATLFLDEPFEGIDPVSARAIRNLLQELASRGFTIFLTSHILSIVTDLTPNIAMIRKGQIVWHSANQLPGRPLEEIYFELVESPPVEPLAWLSGK